MTLPVTNGKFHISISHVASVVLGIIISGGTFLWREAALQQQVTTITEENQRRIEKLEQWRLDHEQEVRDWQQRIVRMDERQKEVLHILQLDDGSIPRKH